MFWGKIHIFAKIMVDMKQAKVLFIDPAHPVLEQDLTSFGFQCESFENFSEDDYEKIIDQYFGVIIRSKIKLGKALLNKASRLKFIGRVGAGMENIDVEFAESKGIACLNAPEGNRDAVGEQALGMLLMLMNHLRKADREVRQGVWLREENRGTEIQGKTVAIIGYGNMGEAFARRLKGFGCDVIAFDKYKFHYSSEIVRESDMETICREADILSLHVPLTNETRFMVNDEYLNNFKKDIFLVNTSRGKVLKTADLVKNLKSGKVKGAALDVLEYEKMSFEGIQSQAMPSDFRYLIAAENVVLSPHIAGWTHESNYKLARVLSEKVMEKFIR
jgi:D-3-phosphoglycerate dehydrogenase / 2-oxoglutarate reductase